MARLRTKNKAVCQNQTCSFFRKENGKEITRQGKNYAGHQRFLCIHCKVSFADTKGTPLYNRKLSERKIKAICKELVEKKGVRAVERTLNIHRDTVCSIMHALALHAKEITPQLVKNLGLDIYEADELFAVIEKKRKSLTQNEKNSLSQGRKLLQRA